MAQQFNFSLPEQQNALIQINLAPPTSISGWSIQFDLLYRNNSPQPIVSLFLSSGYSAGQSGMNLVNGETGVFNVSMLPSQVSGISQETSVLAFQAWRTDTKQRTPLVGGFRLLSIL